MDQVLFQILVPVYNTENYIRACLDSVLNQKYQNFRIVIVDDGSPDAAGQICDEYADSDDRIQVIHQKNQGLIAARDSAIQYVRNHSNNTDVVMFLDSDDVLLDGALEKLNDIFQKESPDMVMFKWCKITEEGKKIDSETPNTFEGYHSSKSELYKLVFGSSAYNSLCLKAVRADILPDADYREYYALSHAEDLLRSIPLFINAKRIRFITDALYGYRENPKSVTRNVNNDTYHVDTTIRRLVLEALERENVWTDQDFHEYFLKMGKMLSDTVYTIAANVSNKKICYKIFDDICKDLYYSRILSEASKIDWILKDLSKKRYHHIYHVAQFRKKLSKIKHKILNI